FANSFALLASIPFYAPFTTATFPFSLSFFILVLSSCCDPCFPFKPNDAVNFKSADVPRLKAAIYCRTPNRSVVQRLPETGKSVPLACGFEQEPRTTLGFIDPYFDETCRCYVTMFVAHVVCF